MPTAVLQVDASALPTALQLPHGYARAFVLVRWRGLPVGQFTCEARSGVIDGAALLDAVIDAAGDVIGERRVREFLDWEELRPLAEPATRPVSVAVCTRDRVDDLARCLAALDALPDDGQEILVVDSASREAAAVRAVVERHPRARYVREERPGLDIARNRALREARHDIVAFCDDDAAVDPAWLRAIARNFGDARTLCVTGLTLPVELETPAQEMFERTNGFARGYRHRVHDGVTDDAFFVSRVGAGANMALRREVLDLLGPFDEALDAGTPTRSGGDHDYFTRILSAGYRIVYDPAALAWHRHRRDWRQLRDAVHGYGVGVWAYLTAQLLRGESRAVLVAARWMSWQIYGIVAGVLGRRSHLPLRLAIAEVRGCLAGPAAYFAARRRVTRLERPGPGGA